ncbi:MAG: leucine-rich repeat domain-containing protein [Candidatus Kapaibacterium sp.]|nr:MAG: leucine-rich repeat domain-containing protein [Candidatus Kapabacteria bacterium]
MNTLTNVGRTRQMYCQQSISVVVCLFVCFVCVGGSSVFAQDASLLDSVALMQKKEFTSLEEALKNPSAVYRLDLSYSGLAEFPREIVQLPNLQSLNLSNNGIIEIPVELAKLTKLQRLNLATNGIKRLPAEITALKNLKWIDITQNQFLSSELTKIKTVLPQVAVHD